MTNSPKSSPAKATLTLQIKGQGAITSFKNSKLLSRGRLITSPIKQKQMDGYIRAIESQLRCAYQTSAEGMPMGRSLACWTALFVPLDDAIQWIPEITIRAVNVPKGEEGAEIVIEQL